MSEVSETQAVRNWIVGIITRTVDNVQDLYWPVRAAALEAIQNDMDSGWSRERFVDMLAGRGSDEYSARQVVGNAVCDLLGEWLNEARAEAHGRSDHLLFLLGELWDLSDQAQRDMIGEHFMPEADDWPADDDESDED